MTNDVRPKREFVVYDLIAQMTPAHAIAVLVSGLLVGTAATMGWEAVARHVLGVATIPAGRHERTLIALAWGTWLGLCGLATALLAALARGRRSESLVSYGLAEYGGPGLWLSGVTTAFMMLRGAATVIPVAAALALLVVYLVGNSRVERSTRDGVRGALAAILWLSTVGIRWDVDSPTSIGPLSGPLALVGLAVASAVARRLRPGSSLAGTLALLAAVAAVALESPRLTDYPLLLLGALAYIAATAAGEDLVPDGGQRLKQRWLWGAAIVASSVVPLCATAFLTSYGPATVVAGASVAMLIRNALPSGALVRRLPSDRATVGGLGLLGVFAFVALVSGIPVASMAVLGLGVGLWDSLFSERAAEAGVLEPGAARRVSDRWVVPAMIIIAVVARLVFWWATGRVWEDALITIRHAENAVAGRGLTHHPAHGLVHGFTSPLSVLVPLVGELIHPGSGLLTLRLTSLATGAATIWIAGKIASHPDINLSTPATLFWLGYLALEHSQISFGIAGMETQIWTCVLFGGIAALVYGRAAWLAAALVLALLSRPEGVVWVGVALVGWLALRGWKSALALAGVTAAGVLPWLAFTTLYYGSPMPNTIRAKACYFHGNTIFGPYPSVVNYLLSEVEEGAGSAVAMVPPHFVGHGRSPTFTCYAPRTGALLMILLASSGFVALLRPRTWPVPVLLGLMVVYFITVVQIIFAWYAPPILGVFALTVASGIDVARRVSGNRASGWVLGLGLTAWFVAPLPITIATEGRVQRIVEEGVRRPIGLWLRAHADPGDYVTAECLGYFGYYSGLPFHDYPGLSSPRAVAALKSTNGRDRFLSPIVEQLQPTWLVLRDFERPYAGPDYELVHSVSLGPEELMELSRYHSFETIDSSFYIYRRRSRRNEPRPVAPPGEHQPAGRDPGPSR